VPTTTAALLLSEIRDQLQDTDPTAYRWSDSVLLTYLSAGERECAALRPEASATLVLHTVSDTDAHREIPDDGNSLIDVVCNVASDGKSRGGTIRMGDIRVLDAMDPNWRVTPGTNRSADGYYDLFIFDDREPWAFYLYPRPIAGKNVFILYSQDPPELLATTQTLTVTPHYNNAVIEWALFRALSREGRYTPKFEVALKHLENFATFLKLSKDEARELVKREGGS
jgi:hypothetical protein